ncbi:hypothetical protein HYH03_015303 [Edaphochlamys debaryana]|uniref:Uncharacterized protein n=1 Tax=Edaphochlamys debaryana TaxID=47281 RepID=A0A836BRA6_9CHLO|nr:hypothetical protein HYH03_015303 [Edaphochlamys debaryana]|eukprot:KAG2485980.1 hypothetical protein HYH03_015303 [Edaphochlamys debaryana]
MEQPPGSKPALRVPLGSAEDVPHARMAIRYIYTGELGTSSAADILGARRHGPCGPRQARWTASPGRHRRAIHVPPPAPGHPLDGLRSACQTQLVDSKGAGTEFSAPCGAKVPLGELLAWAFPDAPSVLSNPRSKGRVRSLPASSLEALPSSNSFATDNKASVLLLLAEWLDGHPTAGADVKQRLCGLIRLRCFDAT